MKLSFFSSKIVSFPSADPPRTKKTKNETGSRSNPRVAAAKKLSFFRSKIVTFPSADPPRTKKTKNEPGFGALEL